MNEVVLIGRLVRDPEIRYTPSQMAVCTFTLAVDRSVSRDRQQSGGQTTDFIRITVFGRQGENCSRYLSKGSQAAVQAHIQTGSYQNKDGQTVYTTDVVAYRVEFIGSRGNGQGGQGGGYQGQNQGGYQNSGGYQGQGGYGGGNSGFAGGGSQQPAPQPGDIPEGFEAVDEDDLPF